MSGSDCEIEFLDEDAELLQQCFQISEKGKSGTTSIIDVTETEYTDTDAGSYNTQDDADDDVYNRTSQLLVERKTTNRKTARNNAGPIKRKRESEDSDYDPRQDIFPQKNMKRRKTRGKESIKESSIKISNDFKETRQEEHNISDMDCNTDVDKELEQRRNIDIRIPNYDDPLCLPVKMLAPSRQDAKTLKTWNNLCLKHLSKSEQLLVPTVGHTKGSQRNVTFSNVKNKETGRIHTFIWSKTSVINEFKKPTVEVFHTTLPKYNDSEITHYCLEPQPKRQTYKHVNEVLLTREDDTDGETLVAYHKNEKFAAVYKKVESNKSEAEVDQGADVKDNALMETTTCRLCAPCYQTSWRGVVKSDSKENECAICSRSFMNIYNLLTHLKTHTRADVSKHRVALTRKLAAVLGYHYKCRICMKKCNSIKQLRMHVLTHRGTEQFFCELGNHMTT